MTALYRTTFVVALLAYPGLAEGKRALPNKDMAESKSPVEMVCEGSSRFIGVIYNDLPRSDAADAVGVICLSPTKGEYVVTPSDMGAQKRVVAKCDPTTEEVEGIAYKDRAVFYRTPGFIKKIKVKGASIPDAQLRDDRDEMDGVTVICRNIKTGQSRVVELSDLAGGREYVKIKGKRAIGIQYNDRQGSDEVDGVTLVVR